MLPSETASLSLFCVVTFLYSLLLRLSVVAVRLVSLPLGRRILRLLRYCGFLLLAAAAALLRILR